MDEFYKIAKQVHKDRLRDEFWDKNNIDNRAKREYNIFCVWCRAFKDGDFSEDNFKEYRKVENVKLDSWTRKRIAELFYGYEYIFEYDFKTRKCKFKKKKVI